MVELGHASAEPMNEAAQDVVVIDLKGRPRVAFEFDGPHHREERQQRYDRLKDGLCEQVGLPLVRFESLDDLEFIDWVEGEGDRRNDRAFPYTIENLGKFYEWWCGARVGPQPGQA